MRGRDAWYLPWVLAGACGGPGPRAPAPAAVTTPAPVAVPSPASTTTPAPPAPAPPAPSPLASVLTAAAGLTTFTLFRLDDADDPAPPRWVLSALPAAGEPATCTLEPDRPRCIAFAGLDPGHLGGVLSRPPREHKAIATPAWATTIARVVLAAAEVPQFVAEPDAAQPVLLISTLDEGTAVAVRRADAWWVSDGVFDGGKSPAPLFYGAHDTTAATGYPSLVIRLGAYTKEGCVRAETITLHLLRGDPATRRLSEVGQVEVGQLMWVGHDRLFDQAAPNHLGVVLALEVGAGGALRLVTEHQRRRKKVDRCAQQAGDLADFERSLDQLGRRVGPLALDAFKPAQDQASDGAMP